jgi:hypothetical protein
MEMRFATFDASTRCARAPVGTQQAVYVLVDPRDETIRYVGRTRSPVTRAAAHGKPQMACNAAMRAWSEELCALALVPRLEIVAIDEHRGKAVETALIRKLRREGFALYNRQHNSPSELANELLGSRQRAERVANPGVRHPHQRKAALARWHKETP